MLNNLVRPCQNLIALAKPYFYNILLENKSVKQRPHLHFALLYIPILHNIVSISHQL